VRLATVAAGVLAIAAAAMAVAAFTAGGDEQPVSRRAPEPIAAAEPAAARDGKAVWAAQGCGSCHRFAAASATGEFAPDLAQTLKGMPKSYIRESIVAPSKVIAPNYEGGGMPEDYAGRMSRAELDRLVEFIHAGVPD
jgi:mono/diheme cytochrome c family protein